MPSFAIHAICENELLKSLNISENAKKSFLIGNIIPDVSRVSGYKLKDNKDKRKSIQDNKNTTHFRVSDDVVLAYPDLDLFLEKYSGNVKSSISSFGYFFHLYTDYYYFKKFLPKLLVFYDENMNITNKKSDVYYVKIKKTGEIIKYKSLFNKDSDVGIYKDYSISNNYLINKYKLLIDYDDLFEYIDQNGFNIDIEETRSIYAYYAVLKLKKYLKDEIVDDTELKVFSISELDNLIDSIINSFKNDYGYLIKSYM